MTPRSLALCAALFLSACGSVPLSSYPALSRIDFSTTALDVIRVAIRLPDSIRPRPGSVNMDVVTKVDDGPENKTVFHLVPSLDAADVRDLPAGGAADKDGFVYRLAPADVSRFEALRKMMADLKAQGRHGSLGMGISTEEFCMVHPLADGPVAISTWVLTSETGSYVALTDDLDLRSDPKTARELETLQPC